MAVGETHPSLRFVEALPESFLSEKNYVQPQRYFPDEKLTVVPRCMQ